MKAHCLILILLAATSMSCSASVQNGPPVVPSAYYLHDGVKIHFKQAGTGRPVIFLHGFGASLDTWRFVLETLEDEYRLVLVDLKGHGLSDRPRDGMYAAQDHARVVRGLIDYLGLKNVVIVGHSLGAVVGLAAGFGRSTRWFFWSHCRSCLDRRLGRRRKYPFGPPPVAHSFFWLA